MSITDIFVGATIFIIAAFDIYIIIKKGKQASVSAWFLRNAKKFPSIAFLMGFVMGHLFWSMSDFDWTPKEVMIEKCKTFIEDSNG
jgi:hypothetical protein